MKNFQLLFGLKDPVPQKPYFFWGLILMFLKYLGEILIYFIACKKFLTPINYFTPILMLRYPGYQESSDWFMPIIVLWTLPFIWVGVSMSIRRAADANISNFFLYPCFKLLAYGHTHRLTKQCKKNLGATKNRGKRETYNVTIGHYSIFCNFWDTFFLAQCKYFQGIRRITFYGGTGKFRPCTMVHY